MDDDEDDDDDLVGVNNRIGVDRISRRSSS